MISISVASQKYFEDEFGEAQEMYLRKGVRGVSGKVVGELGRKFGLSGNLTSEQYQRICRGQHPQTGEQLVRPNKQTPYLNKKGEQVKASEHRPGWDLTISAPKSVSLLALYGKNTEVLAAHRKAVSRALEEVEWFIQAKMGNTRAPIATGNMLAVLFEHDTARPVDGFVAPQLHTHCFIMNMTSDENGQVRALETGEIYRAQHYLTTVYRSVLAHELIELGFEIDQGRNGAFNVKGFTEEFLEAMSPRSKERDEQLKKMGLEYSAKRAEYAILTNRQKKADLTEEEIRDQWGQVVAKFGFEPEQVIEKALETRKTLWRRPDMDPKTRSELIAGHCQSAMAKIMERTAVATETEVLAEILKQDIGLIGLDEAKQTIGKQIGKSLIQVANRRNRIQAGITTPEMLRMESEVVAMIKAGQRGRCQPIANRDQTRERIRRVELQQQILSGNSNFALTKSQANVVEEVLASSHQILGVEGKAGTGKTTILQVISGQAKMADYRMVGLAPTGRATQILTEAGLQSETIQGFLAKTDSPTFQKRFFVIDEASLLATGQLHQFLNRLSPLDRVLLIGDRKQHLGVEAGDPFSYAIENGLKTFNLDEIIRQTNPKLKTAVAHLSEGRIQQGLEILSESNSIVEDGDREKRLSKMLTEFLLSPETTLMVSPDNTTRKQLNELAHNQLKRGRGQPDQVTLDVLVSDGDLVNSERMKARNYQVNQILRYGFDNKYFKAGQYAKIIALDKEKNLLSVKVEDGNLITYDPRQVSGVELYHEERREFVTGDRVQITRQDKLKSLTNRQIGTIEQMQDGKIAIKFEGKKKQVVTFDQSEIRHIDYGYCLTSHSSQGETFDRVLVHADTQQRSTLLNERMAYVAISRARREAKIFTDDLDELPSVMERAFGKQSALESFEKRRPGMDLFSLRTLKKSQRKAVEFEREHPQPTIQSEKRAPSTQISKKVEPVPEKSIDTQILKETDNAVKNYIKVTLVVEKPEVNLYNNQIQQKQGEGVQIDNSPTPEQPGPRRRIR